MENRAEKQELIAKLYESIGEVCSTAPDIAHIEIHGNRVLGLHLVKGLHVEADEKDDGIDARIKVDEGVRIDKPVRICFGLLPERGEQRINMDIDLAEGARMAVLASCTFPNAEKILHTMDAKIHVGKNAEYIYLERHVHGKEGGVQVVPRAKVLLEQGARFRTDFELIKGRVGLIDIDYDAECRADSVLEMSARISGTAQDVIKIHEKAWLVGERARGVLTTSIAVRQQARAEILNTLIADAPYARGHVDCKEIVQDEAQARAVPIVEVKNPKAHVTHEAAIGSVDKKQLETLLAHGLDEDAATDLIIEGLLSPSY